MAQTMRLFSEFPAEVRVYIWQEAMLPRVVRANWDSSRKRSGSKGNPVTLFVNKESRDEALKRYERLPGDNNIYVDFTQDTVFMDSMFLGVRLDYRDDMIFKKQEQKIQYLAFDHHHWKYFYNKCLQQVRRCTALRELLMVMPCLESDDYDDNGTFFEIPMPYLVTFRDLDLNNFDLFDSVSGMIIRFMKVEREAEEDRFWPGVPDTYLVPDIYLVTYDNDTELVRYPIWLVNMYERSLVTDLVVRRGEQERGHRSPVPAFEMSMLLEEVAEGGTAQL